MRTLFISFISVFYLCFTCVAQEKQDTLKVLFVGNSYTQFGNLPQMVSLISDSTSIKLITSIAALGGAHLSEHWEGKRDLKTKEIISNGNYDIVVLQDHSMETINEIEDFKKYSTLFCDYVRANNARPYFYLTWAREKVPQFQSIITDAYTASAKENDAVIVPVGELWKRALELRPTIELFSNDGTHPSNLGTFFTACIFVATITNELPVNLKKGYQTRDINGEPLRLMYLDTLDVLYFKKLIEEYMWK